MRPLDFWIKLTNWEFWPAWIFNIPVFFIYFFQAIKCWDLSFFSNVNPAMITGGLYGESKWNIYNHLPENTYPRTILIKDRSIDEAGIRNILSEHEIVFPVIAKPDVGERGLGVHKIDNLRELNSYNKCAKYNYLIQEYVDLPQEISVLVSKNPENGNKRVTSVCLKSKLNITGDGKSTLGELIQNMPRARFQWDRLKIKFKDKLLDIPEQDRKILLEPIGNHCRGTTFLNGNHLINDKFSKFFFDLFDQLSGEIWYGRFDILYRDLDSLLKAEDFSIIEFNGVASEPAHIYHPGSSLLKAYKSYWLHWNILSGISRSMKKRGFKSMSIKDAHHYFRSFLRNKHLVKQAEKCRKSIYE